MTKIKKNLKGIFSFILTNERINSQTCIAKNINTTKTIIDYKK